MADQLSLPLRIPEVHAPRLSLALAERVFVNRDLDLSSIRWIGFDLDSTLAVYDEPELTTLTAKFVLDKLEQRGYDVSNVRVSSGFAVRGLVIDKRLGHLLKLDQYRVVRRASHGTFALEQCTIDTKYNKQRVGLSGPRFHSVDGLHDKIVANLYVALIQALETQRAEIDYERLHDDIVSCAWEAYQDRTWQRELFSNPERYLHRDPELPTMLERMRSSGKRLFLLTNSSLDYVSWLLRYLLDGDGASNESWFRYFSIVIASANKPEFFRPKRSSSPEQPRSNKTEHRTRIVEGGSLPMLEKWLGVSSSRILYVGDHIYGDILRSRKHGFWHTALVLHELKREFDAQQAASQVLRKLNQVQVRRWELDDALRQNQKYLRDLEAQRARLVEAGERSQAEVVATSHAKVKKIVESIHGKLRKLNGEEQSVSEHLDSFYHFRWGPLLREGNDLSSFGAQLQEFASIYMADVVNFQRYSATQKFRAPRKLLPHEL